MGVGVVARYEKGEFVACFSKIVPYIVDPLTTKSVVVWYVSQFVCDLGYPSVL
jgi:hypothetical protein